MVALNPNSPSHIVHHIFENGQWIKGKVLRKKNGIDEMTGILFLLTADAIRGSRAFHQLSCDQTRGLSRSGNAPKNEEQENASNDEEGQDDENSFHITGSLKEDNVGVAGLDVF
jgi:hypothetical protein